MDIDEVLNWRYATKRMSGRIVPEEKVDRILEAIRLAPSSYGLQPYSVILVRDEALRRKIKPLAANQPQIVECSHLLVFAVVDPLHEGDVDAMLRLTARERDMALERLEDYGATIKEAVWELVSADQSFHWAARQAYIALGVASVAAAAERVDATPMEGFDPEGLDRLLGLGERRLRSVLMLALGYRDSETDWLASLKKVRRPREEMVVELDRSAG